MATPPEKVEILRRRKLEILSSGGRVPPSVPAVRITDVRKPACFYAGEPAGPKGWHHCEHPNPGDRPGIPDGDLVCGTGCNGKCTPRCPGYTTIPLISPESGESEVLDLIRRKAPASWPEGWNAWPNVMAAHKRLADEFYDHIENYPEGRYSGDGVVIVGGGIYWPSAYVAVRMLRLLTDKPCQVWHAAGEGSEFYSHILKPFAVEIVNAAGHPAAAGTRSLAPFPDHSNHRGPRHPLFQLKTFAALHCPFERVAVTDADVYAVADPLSLFDQEDVKETGGLYYPDFPPTNDWTRWGDWGVAPRGWGCGLETGQFLLDKRKAWRPLNMARHYDDHGDCYYGWGKNYGHGDKEPHRIGWARCGMDPTVFYGIPDWNKVGFVHWSADLQTPYFVHRCRSKFVLDPTEFVSSPQDGPNIRCGLPGEEAAFDFLAELKKEVSRG